MSTEKLKKIAEETLEVIDSGKYKNLSGNTISIKDSLESSIKRSVLYKPDWCLPFGIDKHGKFLKASRMEISVTRESTLDAAFRLRDENPCILNFASAKNPGGGFLRGSSAQEESIARSSGLYPTLIQYPEYYEENKRSQRDNIGLYLDYAIYSPDVPIFRNDRGLWLDEPYTTSIVTSPAPNTRAIFEENKDLTPEEKGGMIRKVSDVLYDRGKQVLSIMAHHGHKTIVLGAWGCGIFGNNPSMVAHTFGWLLEELPYFDKVVFAIYDSIDSEVYREFAELFFQEN